MSGFYTTTPDGHVAHVRGDRDMDVQTLTALHTMFDAAYKQCIEGTEGQDTAMSDQPRGITSVSYGKTFNLGNYENEKIYATAAILEGETPEQALLRARQFVEEQHQETTQAIEVRIQRNRANSRLRQIIERILSAHGQHKQIAERYADMREKLLMVGADPSHLPVLSQWSSRPLTDDELERFIAELTVGSVDEHAEDDAEDDEDDEEEDSDL